MEAHPAFESIRSTPVHSLNLEIQHYRHRETGADHYHLAADNPENVFMVALRTVPVDSTGVAHMLEHTVLCGSRKYPVRDPFFMMIRRSLNTFMNAFTSGDWTAYPFASQNRKDFYNLLDVYLDAVFFSRLDELDFAQEGHRLEYADPEAKILEYKGVVYNEMKGAMSSPVNTLWHTLTRYLYPTTTYHFNSGGDPESIPDLSYQELLDFYKTHYHPSNAIFMTYGDIAASDLQGRFEDNVLKQFERLDREIHVPDEKRYFAPLRVEESYACETDDEASADPAKKSHVIVGWLLGHSADLRERMRADLLYSILLENSASPLRRALETTDLGSAPSPLCGLDDSYKEMSFLCGLEGCNADNRQAIENLVMEVIRDVSENGVPQEDVEAALHQLELEQREIGGDGYPFGLQLILNGLTSAVHRGDPIALLNLDPVLSKLHKEIKQPDFVQQLVREMLLDNRHRVTLTMVPDRDLSRLRDEAVADHLAEINSRLRPEEKEHIVRQAQALIERQNTKDDESILPKVGIEDVPAEIKIPKESRRGSPALPMTWYAQGTNGLVYQQLIADLPALTPEQVELLPVFGAVLPEVGCGDRDYLQTQAWQSRVSGGVGAYTSVRSDVNDTEQLKGFFVVSSKGLEPQHEELSKLIRTTVENVRFDEGQRIRELIMQRRAQKDISITSNGHGYAMSAAASALSKTANLHFRQQGLMSIMKLRELDDALNSDAHLDEFRNRLMELHQQILSQPWQLLLIGDDEHQQRFEQDIASVWQHENPDHTANDGFDLAVDSLATNQLWTTNTQVNFCAKAYRTVPTGHEDAAALTVLGGFLRNGYLHRALREQGGAYGGGAGQDSGGAAFRFYSYRDPRLEGTLDDFDRSLDWLFSEKHEWRQVEEAILGVIGTLDKPGSPAGEAKDAFYNLLHGRTPERRQEFRQRVLAVDLEQLRTVAERYLQPEQANVAVITNTGTGNEFASAANRQFEIFEL